MNCASAATLHPTDEVVIRVFVSAFRPRRRRHGRCSRRREGSQNDWNNPQHSYFPWLTIIYEHSSPVSFISFTELRGCSNEAGNRYSDIFSLVLWLWRIPNSMGTSLNLFSLHGGTEHCGSQSWPSRNQLYLQPMPVLFYLVVCLGLRWGI
jgi:hypothetical protein